MKATAAGTPAQAVSLNANRKGVFQCLDRRIACVAHVDVDARSAVGCRACPCAATDGLVIGELGGRGRPLGRIGAAKGQVVHRPLPGGGYQIGQGLCQRAEDDVHHALRRLNVARGHGVGREGVQQGAGRDAHRQRRECPLVHGQVGVEQGQGDAAQAIGHGRIDDGRNGIKIAGHGRRRPGKIDRQTITRHVHRRANGYRLVALAIVIEIVGESIAAVGDHADGGAGQRFSVVDEGAGLLQCLIQTVARHDLRQPGRAGDMGRQLRGEIAVALPWRAHIAQDELPDGFVAHAAVNQFDRRDDDPFLIQLGRKRHRAGGHAAHVGVVGAAGDEEGGNIQWINIQWIGFGAH